MNQAIKEARADASAMLGKYMRYPFAEGNYSLALGLVPMAEETWLDQNSTPLLINRYNGTIVRGQ